MKTERAPRAMMNRSSTAFVLAGGGSLGAIQVGMLAELVNAGVKPDLIVGVSAGALNGAFFAHDPSAAMVGTMAALWAGVTTRQILGLSWRSLLGVLGLREHLTDSVGLRRILERFLPYRRFEDTAVSLHVIAADLITGQEVVLTSGSIIEAVLASTAIPGVFPAVELRGRLLVDGAVAARSPISVAAALGAQRLIVLPCGFACAGASVSASALGRAMHAITLLGAGQLRRDFEHYHGSVDIHVVPPLCPLSQSCYDYSRGSDLFARGRLSTRAWIAGGGLQSVSFPGELMEHHHAA